LTSTYKTTIRLQIRRFKEFWNVFKHSKRGLFGIGILTFYITIAIIAPFLTPNDPTRGYYVAGNYAVPAWFKSLPGGQKLSENFILVNDPGFSTPDALNQSYTHREWNFTFSSTQKATITLNHDPSRGGGSAAIAFKRKNPLEQAGTVDAYLTKEFSWPCNPPDRFYCNITVFAKGVELVPASVSIIIKQVGGNQSYLPFWNALIEKPTNSTSGITPSPPIDSFDTSFKKKFAKPLEGIPFGFPEKEVFSKPANYVYNVSISFKDDKPETLNKPGVEATIYLDNLNIRMYGAAYGLLGTDYRGRDLFAQFVYGARISLIVGLVSAALSVGIGLVVGIIAGYVGGVVDEVTMRFTDMLLVLPSLPLLIVLMAVMRATMWNLIIIIGILGWMGFARTVRSQTLSLKERPFVEAAKAVGAGRFHIITIHILPNVMSLVYVSLALSVPTAIVSEAALSWLGLFDPRVISWGRMLYEAQRNMGYESWWWIVPPGISIALVSLSFILLGYALDEVLNPKLRVRR